METRKPLKSTILFIGIFLVGIVLVILFINKALDTEHTVDSFEETSPLIENTSSTSV
ncbi:hypothetical protein JCM19298_2909 [Nonlabens ulvanivorans]|nr:hypothetical protein [Nonlabens ulvanivorans]GAK88184.1 hypothetical protein JCM19297_2697 [Nonlabens ulvanivorans]GAK92421.1 hypothetical protein JCM19298_2909 [Nonlabens ulvanivorans]